MAKSLYHRLAEQIGSYAHNEMPDFVADMADRMNLAAKPSKDALQSHRNRMAQSDHGHANPGPGKAKKGVGK